MRVSATFLSLALALGTASAADCYSIGGCGTCNTRVSMYGARDVICSTFWSQAGARLTYGYAVASISGNGFETEQRCYDGFNDIIDSCHGMRNGGVYDWCVPILNLSRCQLLRLRQGRGRGGRRDRGGYSQRDASSGCKGRVGIVSASSGQPVSTAFRTYVICDH